MNETLCGLWIFDPNPKASCQQSRREDHEDYDADVFGVKFKSDESPVTVADKAVDALISAGLQETSPEIALVTEEQSDTVTILP